MLLRWLPSCITPHKSKFSLAGFCPWLLTPIKESLTLTFGYLSVNTQNYSRNDTVNGAALCKAADGSGTVVSVLQVRCLGIFSSPFVKRPETPSRPRLRVVRVVCALYYRSTQHSSPSWKDPPWVVFSYANSSRRIPQSSKDTQISSFLELLVFTQFSHTQPHNSFSPVCLPP